MRNNLLPDNNNFGTNDEQKKSEEKKRHIKDFFKGMKRLYHFTSFETSLKIIMSQALRYGKLNNMNDMHECSKVGYTQFKYRGKTCVFSEDVENELYMYRQISLTQDRVLCTGKLRYGFNLHQMWGEYADMSNGVCLVFDKDLLCESLENSLENFHYSVEYNDNVDSSFQLSADNISQLKTEISKNHQKIFFNKRIEWEHEQEYRIIKRCESNKKEEYLHFGKALRFVVLSTAHKNKDITAWFNKKKIIESMLKDTDISILDYGDGLDGYCLQYDGICGVWNERNDFNARTFISDNN